jgi:hypothetical protein
MAAAGRGRTARRGCLYVPPKDGQVKIATAPLTVQAHGWSYAAERASGGSASVIAVMLRLPTGSRCTSKL